ncbi:MAG: NAD(P)H-binding protein [Thermoplasmata archaeon]|nr:NAD(P)H-binding protein [Thermoplasmata archaeon]
MSAPSGSRLRLLLIGGGGGFVGRAVLSTLGSDFRIRSLHRHPTPNEGPEVEWIPEDLTAVQDWAPLLDEVDVVLNLAWYRWASESAFRSLHDGLRRLLEAAVRSGVRRFLQVSVPPAPASLEQDLPYLRYKRRFDVAVAGSGLSYRIVRPTMLFGPGDVLLSEMVRLMRRYPLFPMFGDGGYHVSPIAVSDLARVLRREAHGGDSGRLDLGGPERLTYRALTDRMFWVLGKRPRYWTTSASGARRLTRWLTALGSTLLYPYEVEWLMSDLLGLPAYEGIDPPLVKVGPYLEQLAAGRLVPNPRGLWPNL